MSKRLMLPIWILVFCMSLFISISFSYTLHTVSPVYLASASAVQESQLTEEQMRQFLLTAKIVETVRVDTGITGISRLTMTDGKITHDASFQSVDQYRGKVVLANGIVEMNFKDSYKYNIAAYELARLLGISDMMPVTVARKHGKNGAMSWWLPAKLDEEKRLKDKITPPDPEAWNRQMYKMFVFSQLVYDTDRNLGNILISEDWHLWMIDFTRAFRLYYELENPKKLVKCERKLFESLRRLDAKEVAAKTKGFLNNSEVKGVMERRDKIVSLFEKLIAEKGEDQVLY